MFKKPIARGNFYSHCLKEKSHEKISTSLNIREVENQNYNEVSPHTGQNGHCQKVYKQEMLEKVWRKGNPPALMLGMYVKW